MISQKKKKQIKFDTEVETFTEKGKAILAEQGAVV
jgi:hypothetical protein